VHVLRDKGDRLVAARHFDRRGIVLELLGELADLVGERGREEQRLALLRKQRDDALDVGMKPMSSMRSASSRTRICTLPRFTAFCPTRSSSRPGVATRISTPRFSSSICGLMFTPP
jgi:hypothetical protein